MQMPRWSSARQKPQAVGPDLSLQMPSYSGSINHPPENPSPPPTPPPPVLRRPPPPPSPSSGEDKIQSRDRTVTLGLQQ